MTRTFAESLAAIDADAFDVYQPDVVLSAGMLRGRTVGELALARGRWFTPHTWTNGLGLAGQPPRGRRSRRWSVHRVPVRPARLDGRAARRLPRRAGPARTGRRAPGPGAAGPRGRPRRDGAATVRRVSHDVAGSTTRTGSPGRGCRSADRGVHRRPVRAGGVGPDLDDVTGRDGSVIATVAEGAPRTSTGRSPPRGGRSTIDAGPTSHRPAASGSCSGSPSSSGRTSRSSRCSNRSTSASRSGTRSSVDVPSAAKTIQWYAETIDKVYGEVGPTGPDALSLVTREPLGVVAAIVPGTTR